MEPTDILLKLTPIFNSPVAADVFKSLVLDIHVLEEVIDPETFELIASTCGKDPLAWNYASIGLIANDFELTVDELQKEPLAALQGDLRQHVSALYQKVLRQNYSIDSLSEAVVLALALRERRRLTESWDGLAKEISSNFAQGSFKSERWESALSVLYSLCSDPLALLVELTKFAGKLPSVEYSRMVGHVILSRPVLDEDSVVRDFANMTKPMPESDRIEILRWLDSAGFSEIGSLLAVNPVFNLRGEAFADNFAKSLPDLMDPLEDEEINQKLNQLQTYLDLYRFQNHKAVQEVLLQKQEGLLNQLYARSAVLKAKEITHPDQRLLAWQRICTLVPNSDLAKAEFALAEIETGKINHDSKIPFGSSKNPLVVAVRARLNWMHGDMIAAESQLNQLVDILAENPDLSKEVVLRITRTIGEIDLPDLTAKIQSALPCIYSADPTILQTRANFQFKAKNFPLARDYANTTMLLQGEDPSIRRMIAKTFEGEENFHSALEHWSLLVNDSTESVIDDQKSFAMAAIRAAKPDTAIATCKSILEKNPTDGTAFVIIGDAYQQMGKYEDALENYQKGVEVSSDLEDAWHKLASYHLAQGNVPEAMEVMNTAVKAVPGSADLHLMLGKKLLETDSATEAIPMLSKAYQIQPKNLDLIRVYGDALTSTGMWAEAEKLYENGINYYPAEHSIRYSLAKTYIKQSKYQNALAPLQFLIDQNTAIDDVYLIFGRLVLDELTPAVIGTNDLPVESAALLDYGRDATLHALERDSANISLQLILAETTARLGDKQEAQRYFAALADDIDLLPQDLRWRVSYGLGMISGEMGQFEVALAALQEAANQNPDNFMIHQQLAEAYLKANLIQSAVQTAQQALSIDPKDNGNLLWYAEFCTRSNDLHEAISTYDALIRMQPENADMRIELAELQIASGDIEEAKNTLKKCYSETVLDQSRLQRLARILADQKEYADAVAYLNQGINSHPETSLPLLLDLVQYEQKLGNLNSALGTLDSAIELDPNNLNLQIVKGDIQAFSGDLTNALLTLENVASVLNHLPEEVKILEEKRSLLHGAHLRLAYLYRKSGSLSKAEECVNSALTANPDDAETRYLQADLAFHNLQTGESRQILQRSELLKMENHVYADIAKVLCILQDRQSSVRVGELEKAIQNELGARWYLWKSAIELLSSVEPEANFRLAETLSEELRNITLEEVETLFPPREPHHNNLPDMPQYDIFSSSPTLPMLLIEASFVCGCSSTGVLLSRELVEQFPYEVSPVYMVAKGLVVQAEEQRKDDLLQIRVHQSASDSLSLGNYEQFVQLIQNARQMNDSPLLQAWQARGDSAFYPTIEHFDLLIQLDTFPNSAEFVIWKKALENKISDIAELIRDEVVSQENIILAGLLCKSKAAHEAFELVSSLETTLPFNPRYLAGFAIVASNAGETEAALDSLEKALELWSDEPAWHILASQLARENLDFEKSLYHSKFAADLCPENFEYAIEAGSSALAHKDFIQAIQYFRKSAQLEPSNYLPWVEIAKAYQASKDLNQATASIERAITLAPNVPDPLIFSAGLSLESGKVNDSLKKADAALRIDPKHVDALTIKAKALLANGQIEESLSVIEHSINKVANSLPLLLTRSQIVQAKDGPKAYLKSLQEIAQDYPKDGNVLKMYAQALAENNQSSEALQVTQLAIKSDPDSIEMHMLAGRLLRTVGQLDQAIDHFTKAVTVNINFIDAYLEMAKTYQSRRDFNKAIGVYNTAIEISPNDYRPYYQLGVLYRDSKDYRGAEKMLRKASELAKDDVNILRQLGAIIALNLVHNKQEASV